MEHLLLKAVTTAVTETDNEQGVFEAVISSATVDREKDIVDPDGMVKALRKWIGSGKNIPLAWQHSTNPEDQIGYIDPATVQRKGNEVVASGWIDQTIDRGKQAWRLVKLGTLGFSFGYLTQKATPRQGGGRNLLEIDVFECTATQIPMQHDSRILGWKSEAPSDEAQRTRAAELEREEGDRQVPEPPEPTPESEQEPEPEPEEDPTPPDPEELAQRAKGVEREQEALRAEHKVTAEPFSASRTSNWVARAGGLPHYIQHIAHDLLDGGHAPDESAAIRMAIGICQNWASGQGNVTAETRAKASAAIAEWEALRARAHAKPGKALQDVGEAVAEVLQEEDLAASPEEAGAQREKAADLEREVDGEALLRTPTSEMDGLAAGDLKAVWSAATVNNLPDSAFLYIAPGGSKDQDGKTTPRSLRYFPYKDANGNVDLPHLRNALARIPQSSLSADLKKRLTTKAESLLQNQKSAEQQVLDALTGDEDPEPQALRKALAPLTHFNLSSEVKDRLVASATAEVETRSKATETDGYTPRRDPLRERAEVVALEFASGGESERKLPREKSAPPTVVPELSLEELRQRSRAEIIQAISGVENA